MSNKRPLHGTVSAPYQACSLLKSCDNVLIMYTKSFLPHYPPPLPSLTTLLHYPPPLPSPLHSPTTLPTTLPHYPSPLHSPTTLPTTLPHYPPPLHSPLPSPTTLPHYPPPISTPTTLLLHYPPPLPSPTTLLHYPPPLHSPTIHPLPQVFIMLHLIVCVCASRKLLCNPCSRLNQSAQLSKQ